MLFEGAERQVVRVVPDDIREGIHECALAVCASAPAEEQALLSTVPSQRVACRALHVPNHALVVAQARQKSFPRRALSRYGRRYRAAHGDSVFRTARTKRSGA